MLKGIPKSIVCLEGVEIVIDNISLLTNIKQVFAVLMKTVISNAQWMGFVWIVTLSSIIVTQ